MSRGHAGGWVSRMAAGSGSLVFSDASNATFSYTLEGVSRSKALTRLVFSSPLPVCR